MMTQSPVTWLKRNSDIVALYVSVKFLVFHDPESIVRVAISRWQAAPVCGAGGFYLVPPRAATGDPASSLLRAHRILLRRHPIIVFRIPVEAPLMDIVTHIEETVTV